MIIVPCWKDQAATLVRLRRVYKESRRVAQFIRNIFPSQFESVLHGAHYAEMHFHYSCTGFDFFFKSGRGRICNFKSGRGWIWPTTRLLLL